MPSAAPGAAAARSSDGCIFIPDTPFVGSFLLSFGGGTKEGNRKVWLEAQRDLPVGSIAGLGNPSMVSSRVNVSERPFKWATCVDAARAGYAADVIYRLNAALHEMNRGQHQSALLLPG